ncbi:MAG TPA: ATP-binding protein [Nitrospinota bacterium]|nr:ATP-binding protein [Nitrospinota bacterium]
MKQIIVISGKGGTGKTIITASFASLAKNKVMADCDVDAADLHLLLKPVVKERNQFKSGQTAKINKNLCSKCGECVKACHFDAISKDFIIDFLSCEGCAVCSLICPDKAISMEDNLSGEWFISETKYGPMVHAKLGIAAENSGKLVTMVRRAAKLIAEKEQKDYCIIDGPPGIGCPVIASLVGVDFALIVTEPTLSGIHDLKRVLSIAKQNKIKTSVCINKYDLNLENTQKIKDFCKKSKVDMAGDIPFDKEAVKSLINAVPLVEYDENREASIRIKEMWNKIKKTLWQDMELKKEVVKN